MSGWSLSRQQLRGWLQAGFFILFVVAPPLDIFRFDLTLGHFIVLGMPWTLGLGAFNRTVRVSCRQPETAPG